jgi:hypothetical protein
VLVLQKGEGMTLENSRVSLAGAGWDGCEVGTYRDRWKEYCGAGGAGKASINLPDVPPFAARAERVPLVSGWLERLAQAADKIANTPFDERPQFSWIQPANIWQSRNDWVANRLGYPIDRERRRWVAALKANNHPDREDFVVDRTDLDSVKFLVLGDPGEGDLSQYSLVRPLEKCGEDTDFMFISSDVIYPAGSINQYADKFYCPYKDYRKRIYAVPGNHDWYDGLVGFMYHFCGLAASARRPMDSRDRSVVGWAARRLWREAEREDEGEIERGRKLRPHPEQQPDQPGPYFVIDTKPVRIIGIDTGITGAIDRDQGEWLRRVSVETSKPKILITGKPIYVNGKCVAGDIEDGGTGPFCTVDEIVRYPRHNYVAVIGGDTHNYQRYPVTVEGRTINYIVSGGAGAYLSPTHRIPKIDSEKLGLPGEVYEDQFRCYPLRGDSLSYFSNLYERAAASWHRYLSTKSANKLGRALCERRPGFVIPPGEASALMGERLGIEPTREEDRGKAVSDEARRAATRLLRRPFPYFPSLHSLTYAYLPWTDPPFFNSFLRVEATTSSLKVTCYGVTGCQRHEEDPPVEDEVEIPLDG